MLSNAWDLTASLKEEFRVARELADHIAKIERDIELNKFALDVLEADRF